MVVHIMPQIFGKAGACLGGEHRRQHAEAQGCQSAEHQQQGLPGYVGHILELDAVIVKICHDHGDGNFHGNLADHADGT